MEGQRRHAEANGSPHQARLEDNCEGGSPIGVRVFADGQGDDFTMVIFAFSVSAVSVQWTS
jgi:hypothetical protein